MPGDELLERIRREPRDDRLREVYADWLLERGDPRGEFIALQFKLARGTATKEERKREKALLDEHWYAWSGLIARALHRDRSTFEKGFLARVVFPRASTPKHALRELVGDPHWATVHTVRSAHINEQYVPTLLHPVMKHLESASLDWDEIVRCEAAPWRLAELQLRSWDLSTPVVDALARFPGFSALRRLRLLTRSLEPAAKLPREVVGRLECFEVGLQTDPSVAELLGFLAASPVPERAVGLSVCTARARGRHASIAVHHESEFTVATVSALLRGVKAAGFTGLALSWEPGASIPGNIGPKPGSRPGALTRLLAERAGELAGLPVDTSDPLSPQRRGEGAREASG